MEAVFTPARLTLARERRGLTKLELSRQIGVSAKSVSLFESGHLLPSEAMLSKIGVALDFQRRFFSADVPPEVSEHMVSFRAPSGLSAATRKTALAAGALSVELNHHVEKTFRLPTVQVPDFFGEAPATAALALRKIWNLGVNPVPNAVHLLESYGVRVFSLPDDCTKVDAFAMWRDERPFVLLDVSKSAARARWDTAHELGHLALHRRSLVLSGPEVEYQANEFAAEFLMPRTMFIATTPRRFSIVDAIRFKQRWGVSVAAFVRHAHRVGLISDLRYRELFVELSGRGYRSREPEDADREVSQIYPQVFEKWRQNKVRPQDVANKLGITVNELSSLTFSCVPRVVAQTEPIRVGDEDRQREIEYSGPPKLRLA